MIAETMVSRIETTKETILVREEIITETIINSSKTTDRKGIILLKEEMTTETIINSSKTTDRKGIILLKAEMTTETIINSSKTTDRKGIILLKAGTITETIINNRNNKTDRSEIILLKTIRTKAGQSAIINRLALVVRNEEKPDKCNVRSNVPKLNQGANQEETIQATLVIPEVEAEEEDNKRKPEHVFGFFFL
jgi:hypothetical protein